MYPRAHARMFNTYTHFHPTLNLKNLEICVHVHKDIFVKYRFSSAVILDLCSVVTNLTHPRFKNRQQVSLLPVGILTRD